MSFHSSATTLVTTAAVNATGRVANVGKGILIPISLVIVRACVTSRAIAVPSARFENACVTSPELRLWRVHSD